jgi:hypothetical protein
MFCHKLLVFSRKQITNIMREKNIWEKIHNILIKFLVTFKDDMLHVKFHILKFFLVIYLLGLCTISHY